ncbi:MAG TPA: GYF domain-containing protein [Chthoniobacterales bacterium]|nr:GYF domain-containing protein [Chthoniobacterales bacterium]
MIHVNRGATSLGAFSEEQVREGIRTGRFVATDLGWKEGMANWQPLSQFAELAGDFSAATQPGATAPPPQTPETPPASIAPVAGSTTATAAARSGLPWEHRDSLGLFGAFAQTVSIILTRPTEAFTIMRTEGGLGDPLLFGVIGGSIGAIVWTLLSALIHSLGFAAALSQQNSLDGMLGASVGGAMLIVRLILAPIFIAIGLFIWAALVHVFLMMTGGANKSFEASFRALSFAYGATALFAIVPCCGGVIALVWGLGVDCIAIARSHETDIGRAVMAVLLPVVICCGGFLVLALVFGVGIGALMQQSSH